MTTYRVETTTEYRERRYRVAKPVVETSERIQRYKVLKPVEETQYREEAYDQVTYQTETTYREERRTVMKPLIETSEREERRTVLRPVMETQMREETAAHVATLEALCLRAHRLDQLERGLDAQVCGDEALLQSLEGLLVEKGAIGHRRFDPVENLAMSHAQAALELLPEPAAPARRRLSGGGLFRRAHEGKSSTVS